MSALYRLSRSSCRRLTPISVSYISFIHPQSPPVSKFNPDPNFKPSSEHNVKLYNQYFNVRNPYTACQYALFSTSSDVVRGSSHANGGEDDGDSGKLKTDATGKTWVDLYLPEGLRPYAKLARMDRQIGTYLLGWPCMWSIALAADPGNLPDFKMLALFGCGAFLLRGAGCTINDLFDQDIDGKPHIGGVIIASGIHISADEETDILEHKIMVLQPQAYLGLAFNWGAILGWAAVRGSLDPFVVLPLYASGICWTLVYDTIYAHQDKEDDVKVSIKSTALRFGDSTKEWLSGFGVACISGLALSGYNADLGWPYYTCLGAASGQLAWQIYTVDLSNRADCNSKFVSNKWFGALLFSGIVFGRLIS